MGTAVITVFTQMYMLPDVISVTCSFQAIKVQAKLSIPDFRIKKADVP